MITKINLGETAAALVVVAHPDDETIWMGGTILKYSNIAWTIFSLCRSSDRDRQPKFFKACQIYGAKGIITDLEDEDKLPIEKSKPIIKELIRKNLKKRNFDLIFTHGANGEYGHMKHKAVNLAVGELVKEKFLQPAAVFYFNYKKINRKELAKLKMKTDSNITVKLTKQEFAQKIYIQSEIYGYQKDGIDVGYCTNPEAFKVKIISG